MEIEIVKNSFSKIVSSPKMKNLEWEIFRNGVTSELLMEKAGISGVYLHGLSAEMGNPENTSSGTIANDILPYIPIAINQMKKSEFRNG